MGDHRSYRLEPLAEVARCAEPWQASRAGRYGNRTVVQAVQKASVRPKVGHPFHLVKNIFGHKRVRYRGSTKNAAQLYMLFGLANLRSPSVGCPSFKPKVHTEMEEIPKLANFGTAQVSNSIKAASKSVSFVLLVAKSCIPMSELKQSLKCSACS